MPPRNALWTVLMVVLVLKGAGSILTECVVAAESKEVRLDELKALVARRQYTEAASGARALLPGVIATNGPESVEAANVLDVLVESLWRGGKTSDPDARNMAEQAVAIKEKVLGPDHPDLATSLNNLALVYQPEGEYAKAEPLYQRALAIRERALGPDHTDVATSLHNLARLYEAEGRYAQAEQLYTRSLAIYEKALGPDHPWVATSLNDLALVYQETGQNAQAEQLYNRCLAVYEKALGPDHPNVAASLDNLGNLYRSEGQYAQAEPLLKRALEVKEKAFGTDDPRVATSVNDLALVYLDQGQYARAESLDKRALAIREKALGPNHPDVAQSLNNFAAVYQAEGRYVEAEPLLNRSLAIYQRVLGADHPTLATVLKGLADNYRARGQYAQAEPLYSRSLAISEKALGPDHPDVATSLNSLAELYRGEGQYSKAEPLYRRSLAISEKALGPDHPDVARSLNNLALVCQGESRYTEAEPLLKRSLAIYEKVLGAEHPAVATSLNNLAALYYDEGEYAQAEPIHKRALAIREQVLGPDHPDVATSLNNLASLYFGQGQYAQAEPLLKRSLGISEKALGPDHPDVANGLNNLAILEAILGQTGDAFDHALEQERIGRENFRLISRSLSEQQALQYAAVHVSGRNLTLTLTVRGAQPTWRRKALDALIRSRSVVLDEMAARHHAIGERSDPEVARLAAALSVVRTRLANLLVRGAGELKSEIYRQMLDDARKNEEQAEKDLAGASVRFARELSHGGVGLDDVASSLPSASALVAFAQYLRIDLTPKGGTAAPGEHVPPLKAVPFYLAFVLRASETVPQVVDLGTAAAMDAAVAAWKKEASSGGNEAAYREAGSALRKRVWDPLSPAIGDAGRVFIAPDGALNLVNFGALPLDDGGYLIEHGPPVHYISAERDLVPTGNEEVGQGLLAVGAPDYDATSLFASLRKNGGDGSRKPAASISQGSVETFRGIRSGCGDFASTRFASLPATGEETREIAGMWAKQLPDDASAHGGVLDLRDAAASETALKRSATGRRVLHLATHGFFLGGECTSALTSARGIGGLAQDVLAKSFNTPAAAFRPGAGRRQPPLGGGGGGG